MLDLESVEQRYLAWAVDRLGGDLATLDGQLGISQRTLYRKLQAVRQGASKHGGSA